MRIRYAISAIVVSAIAFLGAGQLRSAGQERPVDAQTSVGTPAPLKVKTKDYLSNCHLAPVEDPYSMPEKELRDYVIFCTKAMLAVKSYKSMDEMITSLRDNKIRTPSGLWVQSLYYAGIQQYIDDAAMEKGFDVVEAEFSQWQDSTRDSDAARLAQSKLMIRRAWQYRGAGYASSVSDESFEKFHVQIAKAKKYLFENESISSRDPEWYVQTFNVLTAEKDSDEEKYRSYLDRAIKQYPEYYPIYFSAATFYLSKWHGDDEAFDMFAKSGEAVLSPDKAKALYARIYWAHACTRCGAGDVATWRDHWDELRLGFDQIIREYPDQWNINNYARIACSANDKDKTRELLQKIHGEPIADAWNDEQFNYEYCASWSGFHKEMI